MILLIAYGNPLRQDDGAGLRLAERMAGCWLAMGALVRHLAVQQLAPELALEIAALEVTAVVFVDTRAAAGLAGAVEITPLAPPNAATPSLGHHLQPDVLLAYAALLLDGRPAPPAWLVTVPGVAFDHGEGLSHTASAAIEAAFAGHDRPLPQLIDDLAVRSAPEARSNDSSRSEGTEND
jgi:hydrogenase maturation protease